MPATAHGCQKHCPFLNRADPRCARAFSLENLDHAFRYCFGRYTACTVYLELLVERRVKQTASAPARMRGTYDQHRAVQLTLPQSQAGRKPRGVCTEPDAGAVPDASGVGTGTGK
ncbi:hypothetical protein [Fontivita pretiosa]|uniref:hypothetical protein n=1 Tax=Fontivita pretiosa TaxID=2989684 RepID=UPI003D176DDD